MCTDNTRQNVTSINRVTSDIKVLGEMELYLGGRMRKSL